MEEVEELVITPALLLLLEALEKRLIRQSHAFPDPQLGQKTTAFCLQHANFLYLMTGLTPLVFRELVAWLRTAGLHDTHRIDVNERLLMFLNLVRRGSSYRAVSQSFSHSLQTIMRSFHLILQALVRLHTIEVRQPEQHTPTPVEITSNPKFYPYFQNCVGALDGTHIAAHVTKELVAPWRNRKGYLSQNVLAVAGFDLLFLFVYAGWEGSAGDARVAKDAVQLGLLRIPSNGRYYLGDAGYYNCDYIMTPYPKTRYHLQEQARATLQPQNSKELFNLRHAMLRNVIERIFGVIKRKYKILTHPPEFSLEVQIDIVLALTALHNFTFRRTVWQDDIDVRAYETEQTPQELSPPAEILVTSSEQREQRRRMEEYRDQIAQLMWDDYQASTLVTASSSSRLAI